MKLTQGLLFLACLSLVSSASAQDSRGRDRGGSNRSGQYSGGSGQAGDSGGRYQSHSTSASRSGKVHYGTVNNLYNREPLQKPIQIQQAPSRAEMPVRDKDDHRDRDHDHDRDRDGRFRIGYYQYGKTWKDDSFRYPYYVFDPYAVDHCVVSPWYYYSFLPGYIDTSRLVFTSNYESSFVGLPFDYEPPSRYRNDQYGDDRDARYDDSYLSPSSLNYAIDDIVTAFTHNDRRAVDRLVPRSGAISMTVDGRITYGVNADDFYDMFSDLVTSAQTVDYQITGVKSSSDEAEVLATHVFTDPWGVTQTLYHRYHLFSERGTVVIRSFETSAEPFW